MLFEEGQPPSLAGSYNDELAEAGQLEDGGRNGAGDVVVAEVYEGDNLHEGYLGADGTLHSLPCSTLTYKVYYKIIYKVYYKMDIRAEDVTPQSG